MGGSSWYEFVERLDNIPSNQIIKVTTFDGKEMHINTSYVVETEDFKLAIAQLDISGWESYYPNMKKVGIINKYTLLDDDMEVILLNK